VVETVLDLLELEEGASTGQGVASHCLEPIESRHCDVIERSNAVLIGVSRQIMTSKSAIRFLHTQSTESWTLFHPGGTVVSKSVRRLAVVSRLPSFVFTRSLDHSTAFLGTFLRYSYWRHHSGPTWP
jgi:hypothetical protein